MTQKKSAMIKKTSANPWGKRVLGLVLIWLFFPLLTPAHNPFEQSVEEVAEIGGWSREQVRMTKGSYSIVPFFVFTRVEVRVDSGPSQSKTITARLSKAPFSGYSVSCYSEYRSRQC